MNFLIAYHLSAFETTDGIHMDWIDHGIETIVMAEVSSQVEALRRFLKDYEDKSDVRVQIVSITKLEEETDKTLMVWCYNHWAQWSDYGKEGK